MTKERKGREISLDAAKIKIHRRGEERNGAMEIAPTSEYLKRVPENKII